LHKQVGDRRHFGLRSASSLVCPSRGDNNNNNNNNNKQGGLGVREVHSLARPVYLASAASTLDLQTSVLTAYPCATDSHFESYLSSWQAYGGILSTSDPLPPKQSFWDKPGMSARDLVESSYSGPQERARFLAAASPHSGDWLLALPITACGLQLSDEAVRVAVALRLGCSVCVPHYVDADHWWMPRDFMAWSENRLQAE